MLMPCLTVQEEYEMRKNFTMDRKKMTLFSQPLRTLYYFSQVAGETIFIAPAK
jgi:hypothetical protein